MDSKRFYLSSKQLSDGVERAIHWEERRAVIWNKSNH